MYLQMEPVTFHGLQLDSTFDQGINACATSVGDKFDANSTGCFTSRNSADHISFCVFDKRSVYEIALAFTFSSPPLRIVFDRCKLFSIEG